MTRVLFWAESFPPAIGGIETFSHQLITSLQPRGYEFSVITSGRLSDMNETQQTQYGPIWKFPFASVLERRDLRMISAITSQIDAILRTVQPDLIHLNTTLPSIFFFLRNLQTDRIPSLLTLHVPLITANRPGSMVSRLLDRVNHAVAVSKGILHDASLFSPSIVARTSLIYYALQSPPILPKPISVDPPMLLCVGRFTPQKGFNVAIDALVRILEHYPTAKLQLAGDGEDRASLESQVRELGLSDSVDFLGPVTHDVVYHLLNQCTLQMIPSRYETFGLVALEAAQMGRPVVASRVIGLDEAVVHRETGLLVDADDPDQLAEAVISLLDDPALCSRYGDQGRLRAEREFSFHRFIDAYDTLYQQLC